MHLPNGFIGDDFSRCPLVRVRLLLAPCAREEAVEQLLPCGRCPCIQVYAVCDGGNGHLTRIHMTVKFFEHFAGNFTVQFANAIPQACGIHRQMRHIELAGLVIEP
ncbi:hypothetical protein D3C85_1536950 [compost metagenome]